MREESVPGLAAAARLIGDPARAAMLGALLGGEWLTAGELARRARITPATASGHLRRLVEEGLLARRASGRHRYYAITSADVAAALEALARIPSPSAAPRKAPQGALRIARTCYDHLAGQLGVQLFDGLVARGVIAPGGHDVTAHGDGVLGTLAIDVAALRRERRPLARPCLDWSERRDHLAGAVGAALATALIERRWVVRLEGTRAVRLTVRGREGLYRTLGLEAAAPTAQQFSR